MAVKSFVILVDLIAKLGHIRQHTLPSANMVNSDDGHGFLPQEKEQIPNTATNAVEENVNPASVDMEAYTRENPLWKRVWRHSLTQMMLLSVQAFCGPAMSDAIAGKSSFF